MPRRRADDDLRLGRSWVWVADAERRWVRAFRLLLTPEPVARAAQVGEGHGDEQDRGSLRAGLDGPADRAADD